MKFKTFLSVSLTVLSCSGLASPAGTEHTGEGKARLAFSDPAQAVIRASTKYDLRGVLTLPEVLAESLKSNPELAAFSWETRAREAAALQAGLLPNPQVSALGENFGNGSLKGFDGSAITLQFSQLIELGGKRAKRLRLAGLDRVLSDWDYETKRLDVLTQTRQAFTRVLATQANLELTEDIVKLSERVWQNVAERVRAGRVSPLEETKASVALASARSLKNQAVNDLASARVSLVALWGHVTADFERAQGDLSAVNPLPPFESLTKLVEHNPDIERWMTELERGEAQLRLAESKRTVDVTFTAGVRNFANTGDTAFVTGISVPLMLFDRNQGGIREAQYRLSRAEEERRAADVRIRTNLERSFRQLKTAFEDVQLLKAEALPAAQRAFDGATEGFQQGKFGYLDVLDAQRTFFETRGRYLVSLANYHLALADVERFIGIGLDDLAKPTVKSEANPKGDLK